MKSHTLFDILVTRRSCVAAGVVSICSALGFLTNYPKQAIAGGTAVHIPVVEPDIQSLSVAVDCLPAVLDPCLVTLSSAPIIDCVFDTLLRLDSNGNIAAGLAERWMIDCDCKSATFFLVPGICYSDGTPCNAIRVAASLERLNDVVCSYSDRYMHYYYEVISEYTLKVKSNGTKKLNLQDFAVICSAVTAPGDNGLLCGTGPYSMSEYDTDSIVLRRNKKAALFPHFDTVVFRAIQTSDYRVEALAGGAVDLALICEEHSSEFLSNLAFVIDPPSLSVRHFEGIDGLEYIQGDAVPAVYVMRAGLCGLVAIPEGFCSVRRAWYETREVNGRFFPVNDNGQTYGPFIDAVPDLVAVANEGGVRGFVYWDDWYIQPASTLEEALAMTDDVQDSVPLYAYDGRTVLGMWTKGG